MAWTAPRTWVSGEVVTAAIMNTHVRDELQYVGLGDAISSSPPASPARYQRWIYPNAGGEHWTFIYRDDLDGTNPWHFLSGKPLVLTITNAGTNVGYPTALGNIAVPRTGIYDVEHLMLGYEPTGAWTVLLGTGWNGAVQEGGYSAPGVTNGSTKNFAKKFTGQALTSGWNITSYGGNNSGGAVNAQFYGSLALLPKKIQ